SGLAVESRSTTGIEYSMQVPAWAIVTARREGRRSSGYDTKSRRFSAFGKNGPLFIITMMTLGKWWFTFEVAAQNQIAHQIALQAESQIPSAWAAARHTSATQ